MKLELTQAEIKAAIATYVSDTIGLDLKNNDLNIVFSATRYEGTIAKLETTPKAKEAAAALVAAAPVAIPGYSDNTDLTAKDAPALAEPTIDPADAAPAAQAETTLADPVQEAATLVEAGPGTGRQVIEAAASTDTAEAAVEAAPAATEEAAAPVASTDAPKPTKATLFGKPAGTAA